MLTEIVHDDQLALVTRKALPGLPLQPVIEYYRETEVEPVCLGYLPNLAFTLRFNLGQSFSLSNEEVCLKFNDHILLPHNRGWIDQGHFFTIKFRFGILPCHRGPGGFPAMPVTLRGLVAPEYIQKMGSTCSFEERVALSEQYFSSSISLKNRQWKECDVLENFLQGLEQGNEGIFSDPAYVSAKSLQRYCLRHFGMSPKSVQCILRVRKALAAYFSSGSNFNIYDFNYYDYSHFYREVKRVTGLKLKDIEKQKAESRKEKAKSN